MNYFATPISSLDSFDNFTKTVKTGIELSLLRKLDFPLLDIKYDNNLVRLWGVRKSKMKSWEKLEKGDLLFFYSKGILISFCKVLGKCKSEKIGEYLWDRHSNYDRPTYTWPFLIILNKPTDCNIPFTKINEFSGYSENYSLRSFFCLNEKFIANIENRYKTIEKFIQEETIKI